MKATTLTTSLMGAKSARLAIFVTDLRTLQSQLCLTTTEVSVAPRVTTAPRAALSPRNASLVATTRLREWKRRLIANCAHLEPTRISGDKRAASHAVSSPTRSRAKTSVSALARTEPTHLRMLPAAARAATTISTRLISPRVMLVISLTASL